MIPGGAPVVDEAFKKGILPPRTANHQLGMAIGELLGGAVQLFGSWCMFGGGAVVTTTGIGAIIGAPAMAVSVGLAGAGVLNITSGVQNLIGALNALSGGGGSGPQSPPQAASPSPEKGTIYKVPGEATKSGKPYIGRHKGPNPQKNRHSPDGRDRKQAEIVDTYDPGKPMEGRIKEQRAINGEGGVQSLDNKRNEIPQHDWGKSGIPNP